MDGSETEIQPKTRIVINLEEDGAITPVFEGVSPFAVPTLLRKVAHLIEAELVKGP